MTKLKRRLRRRIRRLFVGICLWAEGDNWLLREATLTAAWTFAWAWALTFLTVDKHPFLVKFVFPNPELFEIALVLAVLTVGALEKGLSELFYTMYKTRERIERLARQQAAQETQAARQQAAQETQAARQQVAAAKAENDRWYANLEESVPKEVLDKLGPPPWKK